MRKLANIVEKSYFLFLTPSPESQVKVLDQEMTKPFTEAFRLVSISLNFFMKSKSLHICKTFGQELLTEFLAGIFVVCYLGFMCYICVKY